MFSALAQYAYDAYFQIYEQAVAEKQFPDSGLAVPEILVLAG